MGYTIRPKARSLPLPFFDSEERLPGFCSWISFGLFRPPFVSPSDRIHFCLFARAVSLRSIGRVRFRASHFRLQLQLVLASRQRALYNQHSRSPERKILANSSLHSRQAGSSLQVNVTLIEPCRLAIAIGRRDWQISLIKRIWKLCGSRLLPEARLCWSMEVDKLSARGPMLCELSVRLPLDNLCRMAMISSLVADASQIFPIPQKNLPSIRFLA